MARLKSSTIKSAPRSKQTRKRQLKNARRCKVLKNTVDSAPTLSKPSTSKKSSASTSARSSIEIKREAYERFKENVNGANTDSATEPEEGCLHTRGLVDFKCLDSLVAKLQCPSCSQMSLHFQTGNNKGLAVHSRVFCSSCECIVEGTEGYMCEKIGKEYGVNSQAVFASLVCGMGATSFNNFCEMLDLPGLHHKTFHEKANN